MTQREIFEIYLVGNGKPHRFVDTRSSEFRAEPPVLQVLTTDEPPQMFCYPLTSIRYTHTYVVTDADEP